MSVMGFQKKVWMGWVGEWGEVYPIFCCWDFWNLFNFAKPLSCRLK